MTKKLTSLYLVAKDEHTLFTDSAYDFKTAKSVCEIAKEQGHTQAKVITIHYALNNKYNL
jgi:hypothetical protein